MKASGPPRRLRGTLERWDEAKGLGFITAEEGGAEVFLHVTAFSESSIRPGVGALVTYCLTKDEAGRPRAVFARVEASLRQPGPSFRPWPSDVPARQQHPAVPTRRPAPVRRRQPSRRSLPGRWALLVAVGFISFLAGAAHFQRLGWWVPGVYGAASCVAFIGYGWDKRQAVNGGWRVSESTLHLLGFFGGWPGAVVAQQCFRHKTAKLDYQITFWLVVATHLVFWTWWTLPDIPN